MKKIYSLLIILCFVPLARGQGIKSSIVFQGGYNFEKKESISHIAVMGEFSIFMFKLELRNTFLDYKPQGAFPLCYCSPSFGIYSGKKLKGYLLVGVIPLEAMEKYTGKEVYNSVWHPKFECGINLYLSKTLFLNSEFLYVLPYKDQETRHSKCLTVRSGLGLTF